MSEQPTCPYDVNRNVMPLCRALKKENPTVSRAVGFSRLDDEEVIVDSCKWLSGETGQIPEGLPLTGRLHRHKDEDEEKYRNW